MANETMRLDIVTPAGTILSEQVSAVQIPAAYGLMGILANHAPLMTTLELGLVKYTQGGKDSFVAVCGGFVEVKDNVVIVLADIAEADTNIDVERAKSAEKRARQRLENDRANIDVARAELALKKALNRLKAVEKQ